MEEIAKGTVIHVLDGESISLKDLVQRVNSGIENPNDPLQVGMRVSGDCSKAYYREFILRICVADGVLFEDFLLDGIEGPFTRDVVLPAFDAVTAESGFKPLIVRLSPPEEENSPHWYWYPGELMAFVQERLHQTFAASLQQKINALHGR
jgi:hypothetical protein